MRESCATQKKTPRHSTVEHSNVDSVVIPEAEAVNVEYVALDLTGVSGAGQVLIEFLKSDAGRSALADRGFLLP